jgi:hypothetical protein
MHDTASALETVRNFDDEWGDLGAVASRDGAGGIIIAPAPSLAPGAERGLIARLRYASVDLECEVWIDAHAVFLIKIHQQDRIDQTTNSYHVLCDKQRAYVARHNHIFSHIPLAREIWQRIRLSGNSGQVSVHVEGKLVHQFEDRLLDGGYVFLGAKGGTVHLSNIRVFTPGQEGASNGTEDQAAVPASADGSTTAISYCIALLRPVYARMLIQDLIKKTSVPYEILVWLNVDDAEMEGFLDKLIQDGRPVRIIGRSPENIGMCAYRSLFTAAKYELITQIDDDVLAISPQIAERAAAIFGAFPSVRQIVADTWQDEFTTGARPPMGTYRPVDAKRGLYDGSIDGWFSIYHRSVLPQLLAIPYAQYCFIGGTVKQQLARTGLQGLLCTRIKVFHATGPEYAWYFGMLDFEIEKYRRLGRQNIVEWYEEGAAKLPSRSVLDRQFDQISASLSKAP